MLKVFFCNLLSYCTMSFLRRLIFHKANSHHLIGANSFSIITATNVFNEVFETLQNNCVSYSPTPSGDHSKGIFSLFILTVCFIKDLGRITF